MLHPFQIPFDDLLVLNCATPLKPKLSSLSEKQIMIREHLLNQQLLNYQKYNFFAVKIYSLRHMRLFLYPVSVNPRKNRKKYRAFYLRLRNLIGNATFSSHYFPGGKNNVMVVKRGQRILGKNGVLQIYCEKVKISAVFLHWEEI